MVSRCIRCDAALPTRGECTACVEGRSVEVLPAFLGRDLHLDRRHGDRGLAASESWLAGIAPPPAIAPVDLEPPAQLPGTVPAGLRARAERSTTPARGVLSLRALAAPLPQRPPPGAPLSRSGPALELDLHEDATSLPTPSRPVAPARAVEQGTTLAQAAARLGMSLPGAAETESAEAAFFASAGIAAPPAPTARDAGDLSGSPIDVDLSGIGAQAAEPASDAVLRARPAALWRRLVASAVDGAVVLTVGALYLALAHLVTGRSRLDGVLLPALALMLLVAGVYAAVGSLWGGRTLGLHLVGIRLVDGRGQTPDPMRALVRTLLGGVSAALLGGGFWLALVDRRGQTLHDKLTSTFLVQPI